MKNFLNEQKANVDSSITKEIEQSYMYQKKLEILTFVTSFKLVLLIPNCKEERKKFKKMMKIYFNEFEKERELLVFFKLALNNISKIEDIKYLEELLKIISNLSARSFDSGVRVVGEHMNAICIKDLNNCMFIPEDYHLLSKEKIKKYEFDIKRYFENKNN